MQDGGQSLVWNGAVVRLGHDIVFSVAMWNHGTGNKVMFTSARTL